jgi:hypothetical protein
MAPRTNKPALYLDKIRKCRSADWKKTKSENAENTGATGGGWGGGGVFFFQFLNEDALPDV